MEVKAGQRMTSPVLVVPVRTKRNRTGAVLLQYTTTECERPLTCEDVVDVASIIRDLRLVRSVSPSPIDDELGGGGGVWDDGGTGRSEREEELRVSRDPQVAATPRVRLSFTTHLVLDLLVLVGPLDGYVCDPSVRILL